MKKMKPPLPPSLKNRGDMDVLKGLFKYEAIAVLKNEQLDELRSHSANLKRHLWFFDRTQHTLNGEAAALARINQAAALSELRRVEKAIARIVLQVGDRRE